MTKIAASILSADFADLAADCQRLLNHGTDLLHFDVMDGHFVPNISFGAPVLECLHKALPEVVYDVHLMISDPVKYAPDFAKAGANLITFHLEAVPDAVPETIAAIRAAGCQVGISIKPGTPAEAVYPYRALVGRSSCPRRWISSAPSVPSVTAAACTPCWKWTAASTPRPAHSAPPRGPTGW